MIIPKTWLNVLSCDTDASLYPSVQLDYFYDRMSVVFSHDLSLDEIARMNNSRFQCKSERKA